MQLVTSGLPPLPARDACSGSRADVSIISGAAIIAALAVVAALIGAQRFIRAVT